MGSVLFRGVTLIYKEKKHKDWREKGSSEAVTGSRIKNVYLSSVKTGSLRGIC